MNPRKDLFGLTSFGLLAIAAWTAIPACSSKDNQNPAPGSGSSSSSGASSSSGGSGDDGGGSSSSGSSGSSTCATDAATCNSCASSSDDPYNGCSTFVTNCFPFDDSRVPTHPTL